MKHMTYEEEISSLREEIKREVAKEGIYRCSTCDDNYYGWSRNRHQAMLTIKREGLDGYYITSRISFEVTDWTITK